MVNRLGTTSDALGVNEGVNDMAGDGKQVNVSARFHLAFTENREQAYRMIQKRHLKTMNPLQYYFANSFEVKNVSADTGSLAKRESARQAFEDFL